MIDKEKEDRSRTMRLFLKTRGPGVELDIIANIFYREFGYIHKVSFEQLKEELTEIYFEIQNNRNKK